jgi:uncharacterized protein with HEPN domain
MKFDNKIRLEHMLESAQDAVSFLGNMAEDDLAENKMVFDTATPFCVAQC